ncbi:MAG TPA: glycosyltransferase [Tepidisphaeraceae bacterium]|jgi:GT2 family glycosyltransferase|nr:glycosyltransferase [Tepidisphaeraceae bacterium]
MLITFLISTYNRREVLLQTLRRLSDCGLEREQFEIIVVDNASLDGTADAVVQEFLAVRLIALKHNRGPCAKNVGLPHARGEFVIFLDDDSFSEHNSLQRMIAHFRRDERLGAAVFTVTLPDGTRECSAYPSVFIGCGTGFRRAALEQVGGLPEDFFMQAEEYDLSLRLMDAGWDVRSFSDLHVTHLKTPASRFSKRVTRLDVRNNLVLASRHFPQEWVRPFALDWMKRYYFIAAAKGHRTAYFAGLAQGLARVIASTKRKAIAAETFERFARIDEIERRLRQAQRQLHLRSVLFIDFGKNILPFWLAAQACELNVIAIADRTLGNAKRRYRGIPIVSDSVARELEFDAAIVSNISPVHAHNARERWRAIDNRLVIDLFESESPEAFISARRAVSGSRRTAARSA